MDKKPLIGLAGILLAALTAEFNDQVTAIALPDVRGGLGLSTDPGTWFTSLFVAAEVVGMAMAPWWSVTVTIRRMSLFVVALSCASTVAIPLSDNLWTDGVGDWRFVFLEAVPLCITAGALLWWGAPDEEPKLERLAEFDWLALGLLVVGFGSLVTVLEQGDRLDWFNSRLISTLTLVSAVFVPLFLWRQWTVETPFFQFWSEEGIDLSSSPCPPPPCCWTDRGWTRAWWPWPERP